MKEIRTYRTYSEKEDILYRKIDKRSLNKVVASYEALVLKRQLPILSTHELCKQ